MNSDNKHILVELIGYHASVWMSHWAAPTQTNEHKALGDLYESIGDLLDDLAELTMGKLRSLEIPEKYQLTVGSTSDNYTPLIDRGLELVKQYRALCRQGEDDDVLNLLADMSHALNKASYMLQL